MDDLITEIGIDSQERLYLRPCSQTFPLIYREGMEVNWSRDKGCLYGAKPRSWGYREWYQQIIKAAMEQGTTLLLSPETISVNIPEEIRAEIEGL